MKGRPRTPTNVLDARGAFKNHPKRRVERENEPVVVDPISAEPPDGFSADEKKAWSQIVAQAPPGVLTVADTAAVELAAVLLAKFRTDGLVGPELGQLTSLLGRFGMTPADRSKVRGLGPVKPKNKFEGIG